MTEFVRQIVSGTGAALTLALLTWYTDFVFLFTLAISAAIGLGTYFTIPRKRAPHEIEVAPGVTQARLDEAVERVDHYIDRFKEEAGRARDPEIRTRVGEIVDLLRRIAANFREDPRDLNLNTTSMFLDHYLQRSHDLVDKYVRLSRITSDGRMDAAGREALETAEEAIQRVKDGFEDYLRQCLDNDLMDLEVGGETLKAIMEMDAPSLDLEDLERSNR